MSAVSLRLWGDYLDKIKLQQLQHLRRETKQLERQIKQLKKVRCKPGHVVADTVKASSPNFPYTSHTLQIRGWMPGDWVSPSQIELLEAQLQEQRQRCMDELITLEKYISCIEDSETRQIMRMRFVEGMTLGEIGKETGYELSAIGKKIKRALSQASTE